MCGSLVTMPRNAGDFRLKHYNALIQLMMRITVERFQRQLAGQIAFGARALVKFHRRALCDRLSLAVNRVRGYLPQRTVYQFAAQSDTAGLHRIRGGTA